MDIKINQHTVIVFDLDDTLYNELDYLRSAYKEITKKLDPENWIELFAIIFSKYRHSQNVFEFLEEHYSIDKASLIDMYRNHAPDIHLNHGVEEMLKSIKKRNGKIAVITDGRSKSQRAKLFALGIMDKIDKLVISEELGTEKPDKNNFLEIEKAFPNSCYYYIADNLKKDFIAPNSLNWQTIGVVDNGKNIHFSTYKFIDLDHKPKHFVFSLQELNCV